MQGPISSVRANSIACSTMASAWASMKSASPLCTCFLPGGTRAILFEPAAGSHAPARPDWPAPTQCAILAASGGRPIWALAMAAPPPALVALASGPAQHERLLRLHTPLGRDALVAEALIGHESLDGGGFRLELTALSVDAHLSLEELHGAPALLEVLTADSRTELRPFHGHVTACELLGGNGGLARYRLVLEPWLAFLGQRLDSYVFQDMSVVEIVEDIFADYAQAGALVPAWRWDLADRGVYPKRSLTTQYEETDLDFLHRLLADEGIFYWFEHEGAKDDDTLGRHVMVLADHVDACADAGAVRFHRADVTEREDAIQQWSPVRRWQTGRLARASWDYRSLGLRPASAEGDVHGDVVPED